MKHPLTLKRLALILSVVAMTAFSGFAQADDGGYKGNHRHFGKFIAKKLGLSDDQKNQAKAIFQNNTTGKGLLTNLRAERKNLAALIHADSVDESAIRAESAKIASIQADLNVNRAKVDAQFRAILTPDQLATLKALKQKHK